jgi:UDP-2,3-diacylglucosamine hydrolase
MLEISKDKTVFIVSDTHFQDWSDREEVESFFLFLKKVAEEGDELFLLGDIFDFYFEYKSFVPKKFFNIFLELKKTAEKGINIHYWIGNHDFWIGDFIEGLGIVKHQGAEIVKIGEKKFLVQHGDEMDGDFMAKKCLSNRFSKMLYSLIHPELGLQMAKALSKFSQSKSRDLKVKEESFVKFAISKFSEGMDGVIMGHFHKPYLYRAKKGTLALFGDWKNDRSYGLIVNGKISVKRFNQSPR